MRFKGQLLLPGESGPGLTVNLDLAEHHLAVESDGIGLGAWPLEVVDVERKGDVFGLTVAGEALRFIADDTIGFAYSGVPAIERVARRSRGRSGMRSMFGRLRKTPSRPATSAGTAPEPELPPVRQAPAAPRQPAPPQKLPAAAEPAPPESTVTARTVEQSEPPPAQPEVVVTPPKAEPPAPPEASPPPAPSPPAETQPETTQCPAVTADGRRCESQILTESGYCYPHDPKRVFEDGYQAAQEARAQLKKDATARLNRIYGRLDKAMRQVERGELDPDTAIAMAQLAKTMCAILQMDEQPAEEDPPSPQVD